jgi:hypothetical protein
MRPDELNPINKRINQIDSKIQCRKTELELIFQVKNIFLFYNPSKYFSYSFRNVHNEMNKI